MLEAATEMPVQHESHGQLGLPAPRTRKVDDQQAATALQHAPDCGQVCRFRSSGKWCISRLLSTTSKLASAY
jgi:hypothetical protein